MRDFTKDLIPFSGGVSIDLTYKDLARNKIIKDSVYMRMYVLADAKTVATYGAAKSEYSDFFQLKEHVVNKYIHELRDSADAVFKAKHPEKDCYAFYSYKVASAHLHKTSMSQYNALEYFYATKKDLPLEKALSVKLFTKTDEELKVDTRKLELNMIPGRYYIGMLQSVIETRDDNIVGYAWHAINKQDALRCVYGLHDSILKPGTGNNFFTMDLSGYSAAFIGPEGTQLLIRDADMFSIVEKTHAQPFDGFIKHTHSQSVASKSGFKLYVDLDAHSMRMVDIGTGRAVLDGCFY